MAGNPLNNLLSGNPLKNIEMAYASKSKGERWKATGKGFNVDPPSRISANDRNAAKLELAKDPLTNSGASVKYIWVNEISVGWGLNYESGQGVFGKTFYPRDISYKNLKITAQTKSQHDYDQIVEWVINSQRAALSVGPNIVRFSMNGRTYTHGKTKLQRFSPVTFQGYILSVAAGHTWNEFAPTIELEFALISYGTKNEQVFKSSSQGDSVSSFYSHLSLGGPASAAQDTGYESLPTPTIGDPSENGFYPNGPGGNTGGSYGGY